MGLLALDASRFGVVMSADSQPVDLLDGRCRIFRPHGPLRNNPIVIRRGGGFTGLIGYVGREGIGGTGTRAWLERFSAQHPNEALPEFCQALADALTCEWRRRRLKSGLIIFVSGIERGEVRFWFIHNTQGLYDKDWTYMKPLATFQAINDLDVNYIPRDLASGQTKEQLLTTRMYFFRNGVLRPSALVFDAFNAIMQAIYAQQIPGFTPIRSLNALAFFDRQRMEFAKRLYSPKHGISKAASAGIAGEVHVFGITRGGEIRRYGKHRNHVTTIEP